MSAHWNKQDKPCDEEDCVGCHPELLLDDDHDCKAGQDHGCNHPSHEGIEGEDPTIKSEMDNFIEHKYGN